MEKRAGCSSWPGYLCLFDSSYRQRYICGGSELLRRGVVAVCQMLEKRARSTEYRNYHSEPFLSEFDYGYRQRCLCRRRRSQRVLRNSRILEKRAACSTFGWHKVCLGIFNCRYGSVSYTHLRAHETPEHLVCR